MKKISAKFSVNRIIDANINRSKEGLRVCEEICRFIIEDRKLTLRLKEARHKISELAKSLPDNIYLIKERNSKNDIGKNIFAKELERKDLNDIFFANIQRAKESVRVLEEFSKLINTKIALGFKNLRYSLYNLEKQAGKKI